MPTYDYMCNDCGLFEVQRPMALRNDACACPSCSQPSARVLVSASALATMSGRARAAHATNERAANAPKTSGEYLSYRHPPGCGCCSSAASKSTVRTPDGAKAFPSKRPWMISH
jgi:putative FmdB family regulatory protein